MSAFIEKAKEFRDNITERFIYKCVIVGCAVVHFLLIFLFTYFNAWLMAGLNILSVFLYMGLFFWTNKGDLRVMGTLAYLEIGIHSILATMAIGWDYGFALYLICVVPLAFYIPYKHMRTSMILSVITVVMFTGLKYYASAEWFVPYRTPDLSVPAINTVYIANGIISFIMLLVLSLIYNISSKRAQKSLQKKNEQLRELAYTDPLTKLQNRRSMFISIKESFELCEKNSKAFSILLSDIDDFKVINDTHGHNCGDMVLKEISRIFKENVPENASVCRWGGEEILVLLPDCELEEGAEIAEGLRKLIEAVAFKGKKDDFHVTMTFGVSENKGQLTVDKMISNADRNLYSGKRSGKNCVVC